MRLLIDECCEPSLVRRLGEEGHDVVYMRVSASGSPDEDVLAGAEREGRLIITYDYDLPEMAVRYGAAPDGVLLGAASLPSETRVEIIAALVSKAGEGLLPHVTIVERERVRRRRLAPRGGS